MNIQMERIRYACDTLKLNTMAVEWSAMAERAASKETSFADFLEQLLQVEIEARMGRTREMLLKSAGFPAIKHFEDYDFTMLPAHRTSKYKN